MAETESHLRDAADAERDAGAEPADAEARALARFGTPREIARAANRGDGDISVPVDLDDLPDLDAVRQVCAAVTVPVNVLAVGPLARFDVADLGAVGAARISLGSSLARAAHLVILEAARGISRELGASRWPQPS